MNLFSQSGTLMWEQNTLTRGSGPTAGFGATERVHWDVYTTVSDRDDAVDGIGVFGTCGG
jgi:hypothetical protein